MSHAAVPTHRLRPGEAGITAISRQRARAIAGQRATASLPALGALATGDEQAQALPAHIAEVRAELAERGGHELRVLLTHLQRRCERAGVEHARDDYWCWCQPYSTLVRVTRSA